MSSSPLVLIRDFEDHVVPGVMPGSGHRTIVPLDSAQDARGHGIKLPQLGRDETVGALVEMGLSETDAASLSWQTARRLAACVDGWRTLPVNLGRHGLRPSSHA